MLDNYSLSFCQIKEVKAKFEDMRGQTKDTFNRLQQLLEKRHKEVNSMIQDKESATIKPLAEREKTRVALALNAGTVENLVESAPDGPLLSMACDLTSRLNDLESQTRMLSRITCLLYTSPSPRDVPRSRMPSSA